MCWALKNNFDIQYSSLNFCRFHDCFRRAQQLYEVAAFVFQDHQIPHIFSTLSPDQLPISELPESEKKKRFFPGAEMFSFFKFS